jgi:flagellar hook assembly protein FlgD
VDEGAASAAPGLRITGVSPNPFAAETRFEYTLATGGRHRLAVYDVNGRLVSVLAEGVRPAGKFRGRWDGRDTSGNECPRGVYLLRLEFAGEVVVEKVVRTR